MIKKPQISLACRGDLAVVAKRKREKSVRFEHVVRILKRRRKI